MASFLVETFIAAGDRDRFELGVAGLRSAIEARAGSEGQIRHVRSYLVPRDGEPPGQPMGDNWKEEDDA